MQDSFGRQVDYLRLSITDRCNLRCLYCMPEKGVAARPSSEILTYEEILKIMAVAGKHGLSKIRLTGGEPLVRKGVVEFCKKLMAVPGIKGLSITTNALALAEMAQPLKDAGVGRVNISLDTMDSEKFKWLTRGGDVKQVLAGLDKAIEVGLTPVKLNVVALREMKDGFKDFVKLIMEKPVHVRFIEYMPVGKSDTLSRNSYISADEIKEELSVFGKIEPIESPGGWGPARYFKVAGAVGTLGFIGAESTHFCGLCNRMRLTSDGRLKPCLFSPATLDIKSVLRGDKPEDLEKVFLQALSSKPKSRPRHQEHDYMSKIGG